MKVRVQAEPFELPFNTATTAVVIIDMQGEGSPP
jgi:hypothetical protein